jgi:hypothetical protein
MTAIRFWQIDEHVTKSARLWWGTVAMMTIDAYPGIGGPKQSSIFGGSAVNDAAKPGLTRIDVTVVGS